MQWRTGTVVSRTRSWPGAVEFVVDVPDLAGPGTETVAVAALAYTGLLSTLR